MTIISANPETLDGLQAYLQGAGLTARGSRKLAACLELASERTLAVVLFPDDYDVTKVKGMLAAVAARDPRITPILVTAHPQRYRAGPRGDEMETVIVPRPAWGWTILDAIRACGRTA